MADETLQDPDLVAAQYRPAQVEGAWLSGWVKRHAWRLLILAMVLGLKPAIDYWYGSDA